MNSLQGDFTGGGMFGNRAYRELLAQEREVRRVGLGVIYGVTFDLRHEGLDLGKWDIPGPYTAQMIGHKGFYISRSLPLAGIMAGLDDTMLDRAKAEGRVILLPGDTVKVDSFEVAAIPDAEPLASEPDRIAGLVYFSVRRGEASPDGTYAVEDAGGGWVLPEGCMAFVSDVERQARFLLRKRMKRMEREPSAAQDPDVAQVLDLMRRMDAKAVEVEDALFEQQEKLEGEGLLTGLLALGGPPHDLDELVNLAVLYGYRQGHLEASREMKEPALAKLKHVSDAKAAGAKTAIVERKEFASSYWANFPTATLYEVHQQFLLKYGLTAEACTAFSFNRSVKHLMPSTSRSYRALEARKRTENRG